MIKENNNNQHFDYNRCKQTKQRFNSTISNPMNKQQWTKIYLAFIHILFGQYNIFLYVDTWSTNSLWGSTTKWIERNIIMICKMAIKCTSFFGILSPNKYLYLKLGGYNCNGSLNMKDENKLRNINTWQCIKAK